MPPNQDIWKGALSLIFLPINSPDLMDITLNMREDISTAGMLTLPSAAPTPAARLSKDSANAREEASFGDSILDWSKSASLGLAKIFNMKFKLKMLNVNSLFITVYLSIISLIILSISLAIPKNNKIIKDTSFNKSLGIYALRNVPSKREIPRTVVQMKAITCTDVKGILILLLP